jgi:hypothetical protein
MAMIQASRQTAWMVVELTAMQLLANSAQRLDLVATRASTVYPTVPTAPTQLAHQSQQHVWYDATIAKAQRSTFSR